MGDEKVTNVKEEQMSCIGSPDLSKTCRSVYPTISHNIVKYLQGEGLTLRKIGILMGLSESFVSRVSNGQRSFTLDHLSKLEKALEKPLPAILIESTPLKSVHKDLRPIYSAFHKFLSQLQD